MVLVDRDYIVPMYSMDLELAKDIRKIIRRFPDNFDFIKPTDILPVTVSDNRSLSKYAEVKKIPPFIRSGFKFKLALLVYDELFWNQPRRVRDLIIVHELEHIWPSEKDPGEYTLRDHSVQDFVELLDLVGHRWIKRVKDDPKIDIRKTKETNWKTALEKMANGKRKKKRRGNKDLKRRKGGRVNNSGSAGLQRGPDGYPRDK